MNNFKTIVALSTAPINSAIAIIRISGDNAYNVINKIADREVSKQNYSIQMINIVDESKNIIDNVLLMKFISPKSFTGEDLIEINCHGGMLIVDKIIQLLIKNGCYYAKKGEFSQRALFNNKMNLLTIESINDLIFAKNDLAFKIANNGINKKLIKKIEKINEKIFKLIGSIEVNIDYPEYDDVIEITNKIFIKELSKINVEIKDLIDLSKNGLKIKDGYNIAIVGRPNVGKSSLLNAIINENKAIVSNIAGTTRDVIESSINCNGITLNFLDTAGLRHTNDMIEKIGVKKTKEAYKKADLILFVLDNVNKMSSEELLIFNQIKKKDHLIVYNKADLIRKNKEVEGIFVSAKQKNVKNLLDAILNFFKVSKIVNSDLIVLQNTRQIGLLENVYLLNKKLIQQAKKLQPLDLLIETLHQNYDDINSIINPNKEVEFLDKMFENFCLGK